MWQALSPCNVPISYPPPPLCNCPPPRGGTVTVTADFSRCALLFFLCWCPLSELTPLCIHTQMYALGSHVWYHSPNKGLPSMLHSPLVTCTSSSYPQPVPEMPTEHVQEFKVVWARKRSFIQCPWKGHGSDMNA